MASSSGGVPPGFRFHPTDEELLHYYLKKKVSFHKFDMEVIREVDLNKIEPWDLQERCRIGSTPQNEWYFFSHKDRKYPTGSRTNRATSAGFWKATGRDKCIRNSFKKIGMRKTLVFYRGRAPHGQKTDWIMHEYRLEDGDDAQGNTNEDGWVVCRVFKKKNLFKVGNNDLGGSSSLNSDRQLANTSTALLRHRSFTHRDNAQYVLRQHHTIGIGNQQQTTFDLYNKTSDLSVHYSHIDMPTPHYSHIHSQTGFVPTHKPTVTSYDYSSLPSASDPPPVMVRQLMTNPRDCESGSESLRYQACEPGLEVGTCEPARNENLNEWAMLDRLVTSHFAHEDSSKDANASSSANQINQLSLRGEMDFWGYAK